MTHLWRFRALIRPYTWPILLSLLLLLILTGLSLVVPKIIQQVIDVGLVQGQVKFLLQAALVILGIGALSAGLAYIQRYLSEWIARHVGYDLRNRLYDHIQHLSFTYHDHSQTGQLISRCIEDVRAIEAFTGTGVVELVRVVVLLAGVVTLLFAANARLAAIALLPMIPLMLMTSNFGRRIGRYFYARG